MADSMRLQQLEQMNLYHANLRGINRGIRILNIPYTILARSGQRALEIATELAKREGYTHVYSLKFPEISGEAPWVDKRSLVGILKRKKSS